MKDSECKHNFKKWKNTGSQNRKVSKENKEEEEKIENSRFNP